jgi:hypothetical protein
MGKRPAPKAGLLVLIMLNLQPQRQLVSLWKAVENLDDSHAAEMVQVLSTPQHVVIPTLSEVKGRNLGFAYTTTDAV